jgi:hypothetical protein
VKLQTYQFGSGALALKHCWILSYQFRLFWKKNEENWSHTLQECGIIHTMSSQSPTQRIWCLSLWPKWVCYCRGKTNIKLLTKGDMLLAKQMWLRSQEFLLVIGTRDNAGSKRGINDVFSSECKRTGRVGTGFWYWTTSTKPHIHMHLQAHHYMCHYHFELPSPAHHHTSFCMCTHALFDTGIWGYGDHAPSK